jgi:cytochrome c-type biogenesis protein CcmH/NrfG
VARVRESNQPDREELLDMAITAAKQGQKQGARVMLRQVLNQDKRNERAMMWLARLATNEKERKQWLSRVLMVNPDNDTARDALEKMDYQNQAESNRLLIVLGVVVGVMIILVIAVIIIVSLLN